MIHNLLRKLGLRLRLPDLGQHLIRGRVGTDIKDNVELALSRTGVQGIHVLHVVDAVNLLFDRRGDCLLHGHRISPRVGCGDLNLRGDDIRELRYGEREQRDNTDDHRENRDDHGHDRPVDEELCHDGIFFGLGSRVHFVGVGEAAGIFMVEPFSPVVVEAEADDDAGNGITVHPSTTFWIP